MENTENILVPGEPVVLTHAPANQPESVACLLKVDLRDVLVATINGFDTVPKENVKRISVEDAKTRLGDQFDSLVEIVHDYVARSFGTSRAREFMGRKPSLRVQVS